MMKYAEPLQCVGWDARVRGHLPRFSRCESVAANALGDLYEVRLGTT